MNGRIRKLVTDKGYGFIASSKGDFFFHASTVVNCDFKALQEEDRVTFEIEASEKGRRAKDVHLVD